MKASFFVLSLLLTLSILPNKLFAADTSALSAQIETVRKEREALVEEQRKLQAELDRVTAEGQNLGTAVKSLDTTRRKLASDIKVTQSRIASTDLNIKQLENNVNVAERQLTAHETAIEAAIKTLRNYDSRSLILDLMASTNFSDVWSDRVKLSDLSAKLDEEITNLRETKTALTREKERKEKAKQEALSLQKELSGQKVVVEESQKAKERLLAETKSKEALYQQLLAENLRRQKEFEEDLFRLESELKITLDPSLIPTARLGLLSWPLGNVYVTQRFGRTSGAARLYASGSHNGVDFRASQGTPVLAMYNGTIEGTGNTDEQRGCGSYGRWILIKHGNGLSSIYGHLSASLVQAGQSVKTGDVIGYSGGTPGVFGSGYSTGPHLHVGLFASQGVSIRQFTQSRGCQQVYVPIADVKAYLDPLAYLPSI
jgi:murein DD-endopeptidase MepM/ murein hydrolase activator NlpD